MLILGIESATSRVGCAIGGETGVLAAAQATRPRRHAEALAPQIQFVCRQAGVSLRDLAAVAVDVGPGLYTGLRVGITTAMAAAHGLRIGVVGITSLDLLAFAARHSRRRIVVMIDAGRGEVFSANYMPVPGGVQRTSEPLAVVPDEVVSEIVAGDGDVLVVGDAARRHDALFADIAGVEIADPGLAHPSAEALVQLARAKALREEFVRPDRIRPLYLRPPDAEAKWAPARQGLSR